MASLLQMDIMDIKNLFLKKNKSNKNTDNSNSRNILLKRLSIILILLILIFFTYWFFFKPIIEKQIIQLNELEQWSEQIISCDQENKILKDKLKKLISFKEEKGKLFVSDEEFEDFYSKLYEATGNLDLQIMDVTRKEEKPIYFSDANLTQDVDYNEQNIASSCGDNFNSLFADNNVTSNTSSNNNSCEQTDEGNCKEIAYYKMLVDIEIRGSFENYIKFRNLIANEKNIVNIESEEVLRDIENQSEIIAKATVSLVKIP